MHQLTASLEDRVDPMIGVAVAIAAISTSAILVRWSQAPSIIKAFYRVLFMTAAVAPFAFRDREGFRSMSSRDLLFAVVTGFALALHFASFFESLEWTSVAASVTLITMQPVFVVVGASLLLDERVNSRLIGGMILALTGAFGMSVGPIVIDPLLSDGDVIRALATSFTGDTAQLYGNVIALAGAILGAIYVLAGRTLRQRTSLFVYTFIVYGMATVGLGVLVVSAGASFGGYPVIEWVLFLAMALIPGLLGHTVINWALKYVKSSVVSVSFLGEPVGSTFLALVLLDEAPEGVTVLAAIVVLAGVYITSRARTH